MYKKFFIFLFTTMILFGKNVSAEENKLAYEFSFNDIEGNLLTLSKYKNKVIVIVNVASQCGFTKQYADMQKVWEDYMDKGLVIVATPSNDFGQQEPGSSNDIKKFCETNFGITFPITEKITVKGKDAHPFYIWAKNSFGSSAVPKWNFHKIVINKSGKVVDTFASITNPSSKRFIRVIEKLL